MRFNNFWRYRRILLSKDFAAAVWHARRNAIAEAREKPPPAGPYMAELDVTYRCNCSCRMCQRWLDSRHGELELEAYRKLAADLHALGSHQISIAGGDPLMRPDVFEIITGFSHLGMSVNICTKCLSLSGAAHPHRFGTPNGLSHPLAICWFQLRTATSGNSKKLPLLVQQHRPDRSLRPAVDLHGSKIRI